MECRYCQTHNAEDDHRCRRCGRRLRMTAPYTASAAAPVLQYEASERASIGARAADGPGIATEIAPPPAARRSITYQPSLFSSRELPRVVPFESILPEAVPAQPRKAAPRARHRRIIPGQQSLEFSPAHLSRPSEGVIYCDAPVAIPMHRAMAAALDGSIILIALAVFGWIFHLAGGEIVLSAKTVPIFLGVVAALVFLYKLLWCMAGGDTAGMHWTRLKLVNFDGQTPDRGQRLCRLASGFLSVLAGMIGLIWALVDEETLTWHDHISRTFPTPY
jgi:uncharacterized RDD family membrane protein YckC